MKTEDMGGWIKTHTGVHFYPAHPKPEDFDIEDIAHALSHQCRFSGHVSEFYSVAQHSVIVCRVVERAGAPRDHVLAALLHDASEAYLVDIPRPIKPMLGAYKDLEATVEKAIAQRYGLPWPWPKVVKDADDSAVFAEARDLMGGTEDWGWKREPLPERIIPWPSAIAKAGFLAVFSHLTKKSAQ